MEKEIVWIIFFSNLWELTCTGFPCDYPQLKKKKKKANTRYAWSVQVHQHLLISVKDATVLSKSSDQRYTFWSGSLLFAYKIRHANAWHWSHNNHYQRSGTACKQWAGWSASLFSHKFQCQICWHTWPHSAEISNILLCTLIMKYFLRSFSPFHWFK